MFKELNIWGEEDCKLPNGENCACCCLLAIENALCGETNIAHPYGVKCPQLTPKNNCNEYNQRPDDPCRSFHCSKATQSQINSLLNIAEKNFGVDSALIRQIRNKNSNLSSFFYWRANQ